MKKKPHGRMIVPILAQVRVRVRVIPLALCSHNASHACRGSPGPSDSSSRISIHREGGGAAMHGSIKPGLHPTLSSVPSTTMRLPLRVQSS